MKCGATYEFANGHIAWCGLECDHEGDHVGTVLGSRTRWAQGETSEYEEYLKAVAAEDEEWEAVTSQALAITASIVTDET